MYANDRFPSSGSDRPLRAIDRRSAWLILALAIIGAGLSGPASAQQESATDTVVTPPVPDASPASPLPPLPVEATDRAAPTDRNADRDRNRLYYGVRVIGTVSDNIGLTETDRESGALIEINPYLGYVIDRPNARASIDYGLRWFGSSSDSTRDGLGHTLRARANVALWRDRLWLSGMADDTQVQANPFGSATIDAGQRESGRARYRQYAIGPQLRGPLGDRNTTYRLGYAASFLKNGDDQNALIGQRVSGQLGHDPVGRGLGWLIDAGTARYEFESSTAGYDTTDAIIEGRLRISNAMLLGLGAEYSRNTVLANRDGQTSGWGPTLSLTLTPDRRTIVDARLSDRYTGTAARARLTHRTDRWAFSARYERQISNGLTDSFNDRDVRNMLRPGDRPSGDEVLIDDLLEQGVLPSYANVLDSSFVDGPLSRSRQYALTIGWENQRNAVGLVASHTELQTVATLEPLPGRSGAPTDLSQTTGSIIFSRQLTPRTTGQVGLSSTLSESVDQAARARLDLFTLSWQRELSRNSRLRILYRHANQSARRGTVTDFQENALILTFSYGF